MKHNRVAFLFLGETLLIPHLFPIVESLASIAPDIPIDLWVSTSVHQNMLANWITDFPNIRIRKAPGFRAIADDTDGRNPKLPPKVPMLLKLAPFLLKTQVAVCAEQTSLWLPRLFPWLPTRFVKTSHGVGSMSARDDKRRKAAFHTLVPSEQERQTYLVRGMNPDRIVATGYVKAAFRQRTQARDLFGKQRPIVLYTPHWQAHRSSWPDWGQAVIKILADQNKFNVILAPHQRLIERAPELKDTFARVSQLPHIHTDLDSFSMVDGSYTASADIYLGDTSSQLIEFLMHPRPAVFLNSRNLDWKNNSSLSMWNSGEVVSRLDDLLPSLDRSFSQHHKFIDNQRNIAQLSLGDTSADSPVNAAREIVRAINL